MKTHRFLLLVTLLLAGELFVSTAASAQVVINARVGRPWGYRHPRPYYAPRYYYPPVAPVIVAPPPPVVVAPYYAPRPYYYGPRRGYYGGWRGGRRW